MLDMAHQDYGQLEKEIHRLTDLNRDLNAQLITLRESRSLSKSEEQSITQLRSEFNRLNEDVNKLGMWLRMNKAKEIQQGKHMGMSLAEICIMYMAKGL